MSKKKTVIGRPKGRKDSKPRAPYGSLKKKHFGVPVNVAVKNWITPEASAVAKISLDFQGVKLNIGRVMARELEAQLEQKKKFFYRNLRISEGMRKAQERDHDV